MLSSVRPSFTLQKASDGAHRLAAWWVGFLGVPVPAQKGRSGLLGPTTARATGSRDSHSGARLDWRGSPDQQASGRGGSWGASRPLGSLASSARER
jgi:hypothetical protein